MDLLKEIFQHFNYKKFDRIDTLELLACTVLCIDGTFQQLLSNLILIFGFEEGQTKQTITENEFQFFLDCLFRGVMALVKPPREITSRQQRKEYHGYEDQDNG